MVDFEIFRKKPKEKKEKKENSGPRIFEMPFRFEAKIYSGSKYRYFIVEEKYSDDFDKMKKVDKSINMAFDSLKENENIHSVRVNNKVEIHHRHYNPDF